MPLDAPDPLRKFKEAFAKLLPGKELVDLDEQSQAVSYRHRDTNQPLPLQSLSSGEREVVGIVFDFLLRDPADSVIVFDEPELHLHPELSYRLLRTLRDAGERNQFVYCTHSADIISSSLDHTVVFVGPPSGARNQALVVNEESEASRVLHLLGQSIGVIALGRRVVLIEGENTSLDKQTYGAIAGSEFPDLVLVPAGGREGLETFAAALDSVLNRAIWGVDFFLLCDGDAAVATTRVQDLEKKTNGRLRRLPRYHLENFFLDAQVLAKVFQALGDSQGSWLCDPKQIDDQLRELARPLTSYATALRVAHLVRLHAGNVDVLPKGCDGATLDKLKTMFDERVKAEAARVGSTLSTDHVRKLVEEEHARIETALNDKGTDHWKTLVPGRPVLHKFAAKAKMDTPRLKTLYIRTAKDHTPDAFADIRAILADFVKFGSTN